MSLNIETGFHWCSPVNPMDNSKASQLLLSSGRWGAVVILPPSSMGQVQSDFRDACNKIVSINDTLGNPNGLNQCIARIYHPNSLSLSEIPNVGAADSWLRSNGYYDSLDYFVGSGGRMVVIFNELNIQTEPQSSIDPRIMGYLGFSLNSAFYNGGNRELYTLFPGPSGLMGYDGGFPSSFLGYFQHYDFVDGIGTNPMTFGQAFPNEVGPEIADKTMLWHGGKGVFDRIAIHGYAHDPTEFSNGGPNNPALNYLSWMRNIDPSMWMYVTEAGGQCQDSAQNCFGDSYSAGASLADYENNVSSLNAGSFNSLVQAVYGYILDTSNSGATSGNWHKIDTNYMSGFNFRRAQLGF